MREAFIFGYQPVNELPKCPCNNPPAPRPTYARMYLDDIGQDVFECWCGRRLRPSWDSEFERATFIERHTRGQKNRPPIEIPDEPEPEAPVSHAFGRGREIDGWYCRCGTFLAEPIVPREGARRIHRVHKAEVEAA